MKKLLLISAMFAIGFTMNVNAETNSSPDGGTSKLRERVANRISKRANKIENDKSDRLIAKCDMAQKKIRRLQSAAENHFKNQDMRLNIIVGRVGEIINNLKSTNAQTSELETVFSSTQKFKTELNKDYESYINAVYDSANIDCKTDPTGFRVSLDDAKEQFKNLRQARKNLRINIKEELEPVLKEIRGQLK